MEQRHGPASTEDSLVLEPPRDIQGMIHLQQKGGLIVMLFHFHFLISLFRDTLSSHTYSGDRPLVSPCLPSYRVTEAISSASSVRTEVFKNSSRTQSLFFFSLKDLTPAKKHSELLGKIMKESTGANWLLDRSNTKLDE